MGAKILVVRSTDYVGPYKGPKADELLLVGSLMSYMSVSINCRDVVVLDTVVSVYVA